MYEMIQELKVTMQMIVMVMITSAFLFEIGGIIILYGLQGGSSNNIM